MRTKWTYAQLKPTDSEWMLDDDHEEEGREPARYRDEYDRKEKTARLGDTDRLQPGTPEMGEHGQRYGPQHQQDRRTS